LEKKKTVKYKEKGIKTNGKFPHFGFTLLSLSLSK